MCRQIIRRQSRDRPAGLSVLSNMHSRWYGHPIFPCIPVNIRGEIIPSTSFWPSFSSKNIGRKTTVRLSVTSKKWIGSGDLWDSRRYLISLRFRNSSAGLSQSISISSSNVPWKYSTLQTIQFRSPPSIHPGSPAGIPVIITPSGPARWENISWKLPSLSIPINSSSPGSWSLKTGSMSPNMLLYFWKNVINPRDRIVTSWTADTTPRKCTDWSGISFEQIQLSLRDSGAIPPTSGVNTGKKWPIISTLPDIVNGFWLKRNSLFSNEGSGLTWSPDRSKFRRRKSPVRSSSRTLTGSYYLSGLRFSTEHHFQIAITIPIKNHSGKIGDRFPSQNRSAIFRSKSDPVFRLKSICDWKAVSG